MTSKGLTTRLVRLAHSRIRKAKSLFDPDQEQLEYVEDNILLDECDADVLVSPGKHQEAADIHIEEGIRNNLARRDTHTPPRCVKTSEVFSAWEVNNHNRDLRRPSRSLGAREVFGCS